MRSITRALVVAVTLATVSATLPATAAESTRGARLRDRESGVVVVIKRVLKRFFGITVDEDLTGPKPNLPIVGDQD